MTVDVPRRRRIRPKMALAGVIALAIAFTWIGIHIKWIHDRHEMLGWVSEWGDFHYEKPTNSASGLWLSKEPQVAPWSLRLLGEAGVGLISFSDSRVAAIPAEFDARSQSLDRLFPEAMVIIVGDGRRGRGRKKRQTPISRGDGDYQTVVIRR